MISLGDCEHCGEPIYSDYIEAGEYENLFHRDCWVYRDEDGRYGE